MNEYDTTLKEVLLDSAGLTLRRLTGLEIRSWRNVELPKVTNPRIDLLGETGIGDLVHIELQSTNDPKMPVRMLAYGLRILEQYDRFPVQVVLYVGAAPLRMRNRLRLPGLSFEYRLIDIRTLDGPQLCESPAIGDTIMSVLARWPNRREGIRRILRRIADQEPARRGKLLAQLLILAGLRKLDRVIEREVKQMPLLNDILEHEVLGREFKRGKLEGKREGKLEGERELLRRQAAKRFGPLPSWAEEFIASRSLQQIEELADRVLEVSSLDNLLR